MNEDNKTVLSNGRQEGRHAVSDVQGGEASIDSDKSRAGGLSTLKSVLAEEMLAVDTTSCLDLDQLADMAQEALDDRETSDDRQRRLQHVQECSLCSSTIADLREAFRPQRNLHSGLSGWLGPLLAWIGWMGADTRHYWSDHEQRCRRCRARAFGLRAALSPATLGTAACAMLLFGIFGRVNRGGEPYDTGEGAISRTAKGDPSRRGWQNSRGVMEALLYPGKGLDDADLDENEKLWFNFLKRYPDSMAAHEGLANLYEEHSRRATTPERAAGYKRKAEAEREEMKKLLNLPTGR